MLRSSCSDLHGVNRNGQCLSRKISEGEKICSETLSIMDNQGGIEYFEWIDAVGTNSKDNFHNQFNRKIMCRQLHYLLKGNKQYLYNGEISQWPCLCEICKNAVFLVTVLNKKLHPECRLSLSVFELVSKFSCDDSIDKCMIRNAS